MCMKLTSKDIRPLYDQVKDLLRTQIEDGSLEPNSPLPTQEELARKLGVSDMTVRRALIELTQEGWLQRVRGKGTFVRARAIGNGEKALKGAKSAEKICITVIANLDVAQIRGSLFYHRIFQSMHQAADASGAFLSIRKVTQPHAEFIARLKAQDISGLVVLGIVDQDLLKRVQQSGLPAVVLDSAQPAHGPKLDEVNHDDEDAAFQAVRELTQLGHERIGIYAALHGSLFFKQRISGYRRAMQAAGIKVEPRYMYDVLLNSQAAYAQTLKLLREPDRCTALFCTIDELALGAITAARDQGVAVPDDLSVAGFGDIGVFCVPALSTARIPLEQLGATAIETLQRRIINRDADVQRIFLNPEWIARGSTGFPRTKALAVKTSGAT